MSILVPLEETAVKQMKVRGHTEWAAFGRFVAELHEIIAWQYKAALLSVQHKAKEGGTLLVITARFGKEKKVVFVDGASPVLAFTELYRQVYYGRLNWRKSKF